MLATVLESECVPNMGSLSNIDTATPSESQRSQMWLACRRCNEFKGAQTQATDPETNEQVPLFNARTQLWPDHFRWSEDGTQVFGITSPGRATILALQMNHPIIVTTRRLWVSVGWWPPSE
jgi:hypothetical protein